MGFRTDEQIDEMGLSSTIFPRYTCAEVESLLELAGFEQITLESRGGFPMDSVCSVVVNRLISRLQTPLERLLNPLSSE